MFFLLNLRFFAPPILPRIMLYTYWATLGVITVNNELRPEV